MAGRRARRGAARGRARPLTEWMIGADEIVRIVDRALLEIERELYLKAMPYVYPSWSAGIDSPTLEEVAERAGLPPERILRALEEAKGKGRLPFLRIRCKARSKYGWCLRHRDVEEAVARVDPGLVEAANELRAIRGIIHSCLYGPVVLPSGDIVGGTECKATRDQVARLLARAAVIADQYGIPEHRIAEYLGFKPGKNTLHTIDGEYTVTITYE